MTTPGASGYVVTDMDLKRKVVPDVTKLRTNIKKINPYMIKSMQPKVNVKK